MILVAMEEMEARILFIYLPFVDDLNDIVLRMEAIAQILVEWWITHSLVDLITWKAAYKRYTQVEKLKYQLLNLISVIAMTGLNFTYYQRSVNFESKFWSLHLNQKNAQKHFFISALASKMGQIIKTMALYHAN